MGISQDLIESTESEAKYRGLLKAAPDAMVVVNQDGEIVLLNVQAETQFGYRRDELVGLKVKNIIPEGFAERPIAHGTRSAADAVAQQIGACIELSGRRKDGSQFPIEITRRIHGSRRSRFIYPESLPVAGLKAAPRATIPPSTSQFLIGTSAIRNRRNLMKLNGGLPF